MEYGLIGEKLGHSYSKMIHERLADYTYEIHPLTREEFPDFMRKRDFKAINVTIPYKKDVLPYLDQIDPHAKSIGAVNTIVNRAGRLIGYNTDFSGFIYMAEHSHISMEDKKAVIFGNGGAAQAVIAAVRTLKARELAVVDLAAGNGAISYEECFSSHTDAQILINASPVGMYPNTDASPVDITLFPHCEAVLDVVYNPTPTKFAAQAASLHLPSVCGLKMLVAQAKYAVEYFLDTKIHDAVIEPITHEVYEIMK